MENSKLPKHEDSQQKNFTISKKTLYIILAILIVVFITIAFIFFNSKKGQNQTIKKGNDSTSIAKKDSTVIGKDSTRATEYNEEEGSPYSEYRVISNSVNLPDGKLNFGDRVFVDDSKSNETTKIVYLKNPDTDANSLSYSMNAGAFIESYQFDEYKNNFSLTPFSELAPDVKKTILGEHYDNGNEYTVTQNAERAKSSVAFGDFDGDGLKDVAILMDNNEKQICRLLIICTNKETKKPYVAFAESYSDKMRINSFKRNASIYMNTEELTSSPQDGVIVKGEDISLAIVYDSNLQKFKTFSQE